MILKGRGGASAVAEGDTNKLVSHVTQKPPNNRKGF